MKPFLLLQIRPEDLAADNEYDAFAKFGGLTPRQLERKRIHEGDVPDVNFASYSGVLLGGGPFNITDLESKKSEGQKKCEAGLLWLFERIVEQDFPFLASCFISLLAKHQGGIISRKYTEPVEPLIINLTEDGKKDRLTKDLSDEFWALGGHKEAVELLPSSATLLASSKTCPVQMYRLKNNIYATQFHSELDVEGLVLRINVYKNYGYFPPEEADSLIEIVRASKVTQPVKILRNFIQTYQKN